LALAAGVCFSTVPYCHAQQDEPLDISWYEKELKAKSDQIKSYVANVDIYMIAENKKIEMKGEVKYKKPNKLNMEISLMGEKPMKQITYSNGKILWRYIPQAKIATKYDLQTGIAKGSLTEQGGLHDPLRDMDPESIKFLGKKALYGERTWLFEGTPSASLKTQDPGAFVKMAVWVSPKDGLTRRVALYNRQNKEVMVQAYSNLRTNVHLRDSIFKFTPPADVKIEEPFLVK
jgi:outer membrane lipoprotein-sorting protein